MMNGNEKIRMHQCTLTVADTLPSNDSFKDIVGKIYTLLSAEQ